MAVSMLLWDRLHGIKLSNGKHLRSGIHMQSAQLCRWMLPVALAKGQGHQLLLPSRAGFAEAPGGASLQSS